MSSKLPRKLLPAKKAWKSFKATLQRKLEKLNISTAIKRTKKSCISAFNFIRLLIPRKLYALRNRSSSRSMYHFQYYRHQNLYKPSFSAIYVDQLFPGQHRSFHQDTKAKEMAASSSGCENRGNMEKKHHQNNIGTSGSLKIDEKKAEKRKVAETGETSMGAAGCDSWKLRLQPQFRGVDERAEEFISKFRQEMKLEREKSILDFQEMLARSS